jgi:hypothetical protein
MKFLLLWILIILGGGEDKAPPFEEVSLYDTLRSSTSSPYFLTALDMYVELYFLVGTSFGVWSSFIFII